MGLNAVASRHLGQAWTVDAARHVYATADAASDPQFQGVTAARSQLLEAGTAFTLHRLRLQGRLLRASSGEQHTLGSVAVAAWTAPNWSVQATHVRSQNRAAAQDAQSIVQSSLQVQTAQQVHPRLRLEQTVSLGGNSNGLGMGGAWQGNRLSFSVTQRETFVPFGNSRGFHAVIVFGLRVRLGNNEASAVVSRGRDLPASVLVSTESYYGSLGAEDLPAAAGSMRMPRFAVKGEVHDRNGTPVRGAALLIGDQVVFTDSEGGFSHRLQHNRAVTVQLLPEQFVSVRRYRAVTPPMVVKPSSPASDELLHMGVEVCRTCEMDTAALAIDATLTTHQTEQKKGIPRAAHTLWTLVRRMVSRHAPVEHSV